MLCFVTGPGHGGPGIIANAWLEGTDTETYPFIGRDEAGCSACSGSPPSPGSSDHVAPETPGLFHEGGELGYSWRTLRGGALTTPTYGSLRRRGRRSRDRSTGRELAREEVHQSDRDGAVLPFRHLNGYKIAEPDGPCRLPREELDQLLRGDGYVPCDVTIDPRLIQADVHRVRRNVLDQWLDELHRFKRQIGTGNGAPSTWPMIVLRSLQGWTGPPHSRRQRVQGRSEHIRFRSFRMAPTYSRQSSWTAG